MKVCFQPKLTKSIFIAFIFFAFNQFVQGQIVKVSVFLSGAECSKCNRETNFIYEAASKYDIPIEFYTNVWLKMLRVEKFHDIISLSKMQYTRRKFDRSFIEIEFQTGLVVQKFLYNLDEEYFANLFLNNIEFLQSNKTKWRTKSPVFPFKEIKILFDSILVGTSFFKQKEVYLLRHNSNLVPVYLFKTLLSDAVFTKFLKNEYPGYALNELVVLNINSSSDSIFQLNVALTLKDTIADTNFVSAQISLWFTFSNDRLRLSKAQRIPYQLFNLGLVDFYSKNYNDLAYYDSLIFGTVYCATGDIDSKNIDFLKSKGFNNNAAYRLNWSTKEIHLLNIPLPDSAILNNTYYYNTSYQISRFLKSLFFIERRSNMLYQYDVELDTVISLFILSDTEKIINQSYGSFKLPSWKVIEMKVLNSDRLALVIYDHGKYFLSVYSLGLKRFIYKKQLTFRNPSFSFSENYLNIHSIKGFTLKKQKISWIKIKQNDIKMLSNQ